MHAVFKTGGHQYRVAAGDKVKIDLLPGKEGDKVTFDAVMMVGDKVGAPLVAGATVEATITAQKRDPKVTVFKYKRRKNYKRTYGHRQSVTFVEINKVNG